MLNLILWVVFISALTVLAICLIALICATISDALCKRRARILKKEDTYRKIDYIYEKIKEKEDENE